jgi:hypothetical protein
MGMPNPDTTTATIAVPNLSLRLVICRGHSERPRPLGYRAGVRHALSVSRTWSVRVCSAVAVQTGSARVSVSVWAVKDTRALLGLIRLPRVPRKPGRVKREVAQEHARAVARECAAARLSEPRWSARWKTYRVVCTPKARGAR